MPQLLAHTLAGNAVVEVDLGSDQADVYVAFDLTIPADLIAEYISYGPSGFGPDVVTLYNSGYTLGTVITGQQGIFINSPDGAVLDLWTDLGAEASFDGPLSTTTVHIDLRQTNGSGTQIKVDGTLIGGGYLASTDFGSDVRYVQFGNRSGTTTADSAIGIDNITIGTSGFGSTELFSEDFEGANPLTNFDSTTGDVEVGEFGGGGSSSEGGTRQPLWLLDLYNQDGSDDPNSKDLVATVQPENLHFVKNQGEVGPHEFDAEISMGAVDIEGNTISFHNTTTTWIGPYRTDFALRRDDIATPVMAGMITMYGGADAGAEHVKIAGKSYMHYLERRCWPYDTELSVINWPTGLRFKRTGVEVGVIVKDILETVRDASSFSYSLDYTVQCDNTGHNINYEIGAFETQSVYELVRALAEQDKSDGGFDFIMTWDKRFRLYYPEHGDPDDPVLTLEIDGETGFANMLQSAFTNTGPEATHVLGLGAGTANQLHVNRHFRDSSQVFRRLDVVQDFGDVKNAAELASLTGGYVQHGSNPIHEVEITVDTTLFPDFWTQVVPYMYIQITYDLGYHKVDSVHQIVSMDCTVDLEGNESCTFGLNQHYAGLNPERAGLDDY